jgi:hypothetical protein
MQPSIEGLNHDVEISPLALRGLVAVTDELDREIKILSRNVEEYKAGKINYFSQENQEYFIQVADRASNIAESIVSSIFKVAQDKFRMEDGAPLSGYEKSTFRGIGNISGLHDSIDRLSPSGSIESSLPQRSKETSPRVQSTSWPRQVEVGVGLRPAGSAPALFRSSPQASYRVQIPAGAQTVRVDPGAVLIQGPRVTSHVVPTSVDPTQSGIPVSAPRAAPSSRPVVTAFSNLTVRTVYIGPSEAVYRVVRFVGTLRR